MKLDLVSILLSFIIIQLLLMSVFLFTREKKRQTHLFLGLFFLALCLNLTDGFLLLNGFYFDFPNFALWGTALSLVFGPLLLLYTQSALHRDFRLSWRLLLHFLPFLIVQILTLSAYLTLNRAAKINLLQQIRAQDFHGASDVVSLLIFGQFFVYFYFSRRLLRRYKVLADQTSSNFDNNNLAWLRTLQNGVLVFFCFGLLNTFVALTAFAEIYYTVFFLLVASIFVFVNRVVLKALNSPHFFSPSEAETTVLIAENTEGGKARYAAALLDADEKDWRKNQLLDYMTTARPYLNPDLSLEALAAQMQMKPRALSQLINEMLAQNFFDFVNTYRIEAAQRLLSDTNDPKITVLEVLYATGFNSKSSFNTLFKKQTGLTPSEFKRQALEKGSETRST